MKPLIVLVLTIVVAISAVCPVAAESDGEVVTEPIRTFGLGTLEGAAYSPDGRYVATFGGGGAFLWGLDTGEIVRRFVSYESTDFPSNVLSVAFSRDATHLLTCEELATRLWDISTLECVRTFTRHWGITSATFSRDDTRLLTTNGSPAAYLWDTADGSIIQAFVDNTSSVSCVAFSPDEAQILTGSYDNTAKLWDASSGDLIRTFEGHTNNVRSVAFSPDGTKVLTGSGDMTAKLWDAATGVCLLTLTGHTNAISSVAFSRDGARILTGSWDGSARLWDATTATSMTTFQARQGSLDSATFSPDEATVLTKGLDETVKLWDTATGERIRTLLGHTDKIFSAAFSPGGTQVLTGSWDHSGMLWNAIDGSLVRKFVGHKGWIESVAFSPTGAYVITGSVDKTAKLWDATTGECIRTFTGHTSCVLSVAFSPDGTKLLTGSLDHTAKSWDASTGECIRTLEGHESAITSVAYSPDGLQILTGSTDKTSKLWDAATGSPIRTFGPLTRDIATVAFSPDGDLVATGTSGFGGNARLWDPIDGNCVCTLEWRPSHGVGSLALSPEGRYMVTASADSYGHDKTTKLWDITTGQCIGTFKAHTSSVSSLAFSPDGTKVLTGSYDGTAKLWDAGPRPQIPFTPAHPIRDPWSLAVNFGENCETNFGHLGEDYAAPVGTTVRSAAAGQVVLVHYDAYPDQDRGWGNAIIVRHELSDGQVLYTQYAHLQNVYVHEGNVVARGAPIGTIGTTGRTWGPHLHFEIKDTPVLGPGYSGRNFTADEVVVDCVTYFRPRTYIQFYQPAPSDTARVVRTMGLGLRLRAEPGLHAAILAVIPEGEEVALRGLVVVADGYVWRSAEYGGMEGWVASEYLSLQELAAPPPPPPSELQQISLERALPVEPGGLAGSEGVMLRATTPEDPAKHYCIQFELRPVGTAFTQPIAESSFVDGGLRGAVCFADLAAGGHHWRVRVVDEDGQTSEWAEFAAGDHADFVAEIVQKPDTSFHQKPPILYPGADIWFLSDSEDWQNHTFHWNIDGDAKTGPSVVHVFDEPGEYTVILTVTDERGIQATRTRHVEVLPGDIVAAINNLTNTTENALLNVLQNATESAQAANYFHSSVDRAAFKTALAGVLTIAAEALPANQARQLAEQLLLDTVPEVSKAVIEAISEDRASKLYDSEYTYVSAFIDRPYLISYVEAQLGKLASLRDRAVAAAGNMSPEQAARFARDLRERALGTTRLDNNYQRKARLAIIYGELKEKDQNSLWWWIAKPLFRISHNILLGVATGGSTGYAQYLIPGGRRIISTAVEMAEILEEQSIDIQMLSLCMTVLCEANSVCDDVVRNFERAVAQMETSGIPADHPRGEISSICSGLEFSLSRFTAGGWPFRQSGYVNTAYSRVEIRNTGEVPATFSLTSYYFASFTTAKLLQIPAPIFKKSYELPVANTKEGVWLPPGGSRTIEVTWVSEKGGRMPHGDIWYYLTARTEDSVFLLDSLCADFEEGCRNYSDTPVDDRVQRSLANEQLSEVRLLPMPVRSTLISNLGSIRHELHLTVSNPHDIPLLMNLEQQLPEDASILRADGGSVSETGLLWELYLQPGDTRWFAVEFLSSDVHEGTELAGASLSIYDAVNDIWVTFDSTVAQAQTDTRLSGDVNLDCAVNVLDLIAIRNVLNKDVASGDNWKADVNADGKINILDLITVRNNLNKRCE